MNGQALITSNEQYTKGINHPQFKDGRWMNFEKVYEKKWISIKKINVKTEQDRNHVKNGECY